MSNAELVVWSIHLGALLPIILSCLVEGVWGKVRWATESAAFLVTAFAYAAFMSGWATRWFGPVVPGWVAMAPGLVAPISVILGTWGMRNWLGTKKRERLADVTLQLALALCGIAILMVLMFDPMTPHAQRVGLMRWDAPASWVLHFSLAASAFGMFVTTLACARVAIHGDRRAWQMLGVSFVTGGVNVLLLLRVAFGWQPSLGVLATAVALYIPANLVLMRAAYKRGRSHVQADRVLHLDAGRDPITRLHMGASMVATMDKAYSRSLGLEHRPVIVAVRLFNADDIVKETGENGYNQVVLATLARIRKTVSPSDLVGRYYGSCFIVQINGRVTPQYLRGLGLRLASSVRRPVVPRLPPTGFEDEEPIETDIGVGICWCDALNDLTLALHEAEVAAKAAQGFRSRAAVKTSPDTPAVAVEKALGEARLKPGLIEGATAGIRRVVGERMGRAPVRKPSQRASGKGRAGG